MLDILAITGPIYFSIAVGFFTTRLGLFAKADKQVFGRFVINIAVPTMLFKAMAERPIGEVLNASYMLAYLGGTLFLACLGLFWYRSVARLSPTTSAFYTMGITCSNSVFIGYPVLLLTVAPIAGVAMALNTIVENFVLIPLMLALAESGRVKSVSWYTLIGKSLLRLLRNPMIIGMLAGIVFSLLGWKLPRPLAQTVSMFAITTGALSLFFIGCTLAGLPMRGMVGKVMPVVVGKLILHPLAVFLALAVLPLLGMPALDHDLRMAAVLMAAVPMLSIYSILAQIYGQEDFSAAALLVTTIVSFFTLNGLLWVLKVVPM
jgi:malonate transporter